MITTDHTQKNYITINKIQTTITKFWIICIIQYKLDYPPTLTMKKYLIMLKDKCIKALELSNHKLNLQYLNKNKDGKTKQKHIEHHT